MEYVLTLALCLSLSNSCSPPIVHEIKFKDLYDCIQGGYEESVGIMESVGREDTNKTGASVQFICKKIQTKES